MKSWQNFVLEPPTGKLWASEHLHQEASRFVYELEKEFPGNIFQLVKKRAWHYNVLPMDSPKVVLTDA